jgi:hypothetical protein
LPYRYLREAVLNRRAVDEFTAVASSTEMSPEFGEAIKHSIRRYEEAIKRPPICASVRDFGSLILVRRDALKTSSRLIGSLITRFRVFIRQRPLATFPDGS